MSQYRVSKSAVGMAATSIISFVDDTREKTKEVKIRLEMSKGWWKFPAKTREDALDKIEKECFPWRPAYETLFEGEYNWAKGMLEILEIDISEDDVLTLDKKDINLVKVGLSYANE